MLAVVVSCCFAVGYYLSAPALSRAAGSLALVSWDTEQICSAHPFASAALLRFLLSFVQGCLLYDIFCAPFVLVHTLYSPQVLQYLIHLLFPFSSPFELCRILFISFHFPLVSFVVVDLVSVPWGHYSPFVLPVHSSPARWHTVVL